MLKIVGYIDDDPIRKGVRVSGYPVVGTSSDLFDILERREVDCVVVNTSLVDAERLEALDRICQEHDVELLRLHIHLKRLTAVS
jgi:FlaA1/EpsC-like NDP-sugar epimerase